MEGENGSNSGKVANPFARGGLLRSPPQQTEGAEPRQEAALQQSAVPSEQQQLPTNSGWSVPQQQPKVVAAKNLTDDLHEFVDKKHNVHKDIKDLVLKIRRALGAAVKEWHSVMQRADEAESALAATKHDLAAATQRQQQRATVENMETPKNHRNTRSEKRGRDTPGEEEVPKKQRSERERASNRRDDGWRTVENQQAKKKKRKEKSNTKLPVFDTSC